MTEYRTGRRLGRLLRALGLAKSVTPRPSKRVRKVHVAALDGGNLQDEQAAEQAQFLAENAYQAQVNTVWIFASVCAIARAAAGVPFGLFEVFEGRDGDPVTEPITDPAINRIIERPNRDMSWADLVEANFSYAELTGNFYNEKIPNPDGTVHELFSVRADLMAPIPSKKDRVAGYEFTLENGRTRFIPPERIAHFRYFNAVSDVVGMAPFAAAVQATTVDVFAQLHNKRFFQNGALPGGVLETEEELDEDAVRFMREQWATEHGSSNRSHLPAVLANGMKFVPHDIRPDMAFVELRRMSRTEILAAFGVPSVVVGVLDDASYANALTQERNFWRNTMLPKLRKFEDWFNLTIAPSLTADGRNIVGRFDVSEIEPLQEDSTARAARENADIAAGKKTINEVREENNLPPVPWGDTWWQPVSVVPATGAPAPAEPDVAAGLNGRAPGLLQAAKRLVYTPERRIQVAKRFNRDVERASVPLSRALSEFLDRLARKEAARLQNVSKASGIVLKIDRVDRAELIGILESHGLRQVELSGRAAAAELGERFVLGPTVQTSIGKTLTARADRILAEVTRVTQDIIAGALEDGTATIGEIAELVGDGIRGAPVVNAPDRFVRAERIARTETTAAANLGIEEGYRQSGVEAKEWITVIDGNNGDRAHDELDGRSVPIDQTFTTPEGNELRFPGDPSAPVGDIVNCRCTIAPVLRIERRAPKGFREQVIEMAERTIQ